MSHSHWAEEMETSSLIKKNKQGPDPTDTNVQA